MKWSAVIAAGLVAAVSSAATAHPGVHARVDAVSAQIHQAPSADLYLKRAELRISHGNFEGARHDVAHARKLAPDNANIDLVHGLLELEAGRPQAASRYLSKFLASRGNHARALVLRAKAHSALGEHVKAAADLSAAIDAERSPRPAWYLRRADELVAADQSDAAVAGLRQGIEKLGLLVVLVEKAVEISEARRNWDVAIGLVEELPAGLRQTPKWLVRAAQLHAAAGRVEVACASYRRALEAIRQLPESRRRAPAIEALRRCAKTAIAADLPCAKTAIAADLP